MGKVDKVCTRMITGYVTCYSAGEHQPWAADLSLTRMDGRWSGASLQMTVYSEDVPTSDHAETLTCRRELVNIYTANAWIVECLQVLGLPCDAKDNRVITAALKDLEALTASDAWEER